MGEIGVDSFAGEVAVVGRRFVGVVGDSVAIGDDGDVIDVAGVGAGVANSVAFVGISVVGSDEVAFSVVVVGVAVSEAGETVPVALVGLNSVAFTVGLEAEVEEIVGNVVALPSAGITVAFNVGLTAEAVEMFPDVAFVGNLDVEVAFAVGLGADVVETFPDVEDGTNVVASVVVVAFTVGLVETLLRDVAFTGNVAEVAETFPGVASLGNVGVEGAGAAVDIGNVAFTVELGAEVVEIFPDVAFVRNGGVEGTRVAELGAEVVEKFPDVAFVGNVGVEGTRVAAEVVEIFPAVAFVGNAVELGAEVVETFPGVAFVGKVGVDETSAAEVGGKVVETFRDATFVVEGLVGKLGVGFVGGTVSVAFTIKAAEEKAAVDDTKSTRRTALDVSTGKTKEELGRTIGNRNKVEEATASADVVSKTALLVADVEKNCSDVDKGSTRESELVIPTLSSADEDGNTNVDAVLEIEEKLRTENVASGSSTDVEETGRNAVEVTKRDDAITVELSATPG